MLENFYWKQYWTVPKKVKQQFLAFKIVFNTSVPVCLYNMEPRVQIIPLTFSLTLI